jgi:hypothetical protein
MNFPGFSSVQGSNGGSGDYNPRVNPNLSGSDGATFVEVALGLIDSPSTAATSSAPSTLANNTRANTTLANNTLISNSVATAPVAAAAPASAIASAAPAENSAATTTASSTPIVLTQAQTDSIFSAVLTPAQYLNNVMARIQTGSPVPGDTPLTVTQTLQQALDDSYSTPENPYVECSNPTAAAALVAQIAGPNANLMVPTAATMTFPPAAPAGWVGNYTVGYATQSSGFNDATETFSS